MAASVVVVDIALSIQIGVVLRYQRNRDTHGETALIKLRYPTFALGALIGVLAICALVWAISSNFRPKLTVIITD